MKGSVTVNYKLWRQYLEYLRSYTKTSSTQLGLQAGISGSTVSFWDTKEIQGISKRAYRGIWEYAVAHRAKTYDAFMENPESNPFMSLPEKEKRKERKTSCVEVYVPANCIDCRFVEVVQLEHYKCNLFQTHLFSTAEGDILKAEECKYAD